MKRHGLIGILIVGLAVIPALAQTEPAAQEPKEEPPAAIRQPTDITAVPGGREVGRARMQWAFQRIIEELNLDEQQRAKFQEITDRRSGEMLDLEERWREIREAQNAGDHERAAQLREGIRGQRGPESGMAEALQELEPLLNEDQVARLWGMQDQMEQRRMDRERFQWAVSELPEQLELDPVQKVRYQKLLESQRERMSSGMTELRPLMDQIREARAAGDHDKARELQKLLEESVPKREDIIDSFLDQLPEFLNEEQVALLETLRAEFDAPETAAADAATVRLDIRIVLRAAKRVRVEDEQRERLREIEREAIAAYRKTPREDEDARAKISDELKTKITTIFDEKQNQDFETLLRRLGARRGEHKQP